MLIRAIKHLYVQVATIFARERSPKMLDQLNVQLADPVSHVLNVIDSKGPAAQVHNRAGQRFVHWNVGRSKPDDPALVTDGLQKCLAQCDRYVLDRVMGIYVQVTLATYFKVKKAMTRE